MNYIVSANVFSKKKTTKKENSKFRMVINFILMILKLSTLIRGENMLCKECSCRQDETNFYLNCFNDTFNITQSNSLEHLNYFNKSLHITLNSIHLRLIKMNFNFVSIVSLDLSINKNDFNDYLSAINQFSSLSKLNLSFNMISILRTNQFSNLNELKVLDLNRNKIFYFETNSFCGLNNLIELNISRNWLTEIEQADFDCLISVQTINLDFNKVKKIRNKVFTALNNVVNISLQNNKINKIESDAFKGLISISRSKSSLIVDETL